MKWKRKMGKERIKKRIEIRWNGKEKWEKKELKKELKFDEMEKKNGKRKN